MEVIMVGYKFGKLVLCLLILSFNLISCGGSSDSDAETQVGIPSTSLPENARPTISGTPLEAIQYANYSFIPVIADADNETLTLTIINKPSWLTFNDQTGELSGLPTIIDIGLYSGVTITVDDGKNTAQLTFDITVVINAVENAIRTGIATGTSPELFLSAGLTSIERNVSKFNTAKTQIFNLNTNGVTQSGSLNSINWDPSHDASTFTSTFGFNEAILISNAVTDIDKTIYNKALAIIGSNNTGTEEVNYMVFGSNPMRNYYRNNDAINDQMHQFLKNSIQWLVQRDNFNEKPLNIVMSQLSQTHYFPDQVATRAWFDQYYSNNVNYNNPVSCNGLALISCVSEETDLLIISQVNLNGDDEVKISQAVQTIIDQGTPVLYLHNDGTQTRLGELLLPIFKVNFEWDNYWKNLQISSFNGQSLYNTTPADITLVKDLLTSFSNKNFNIDLSACDNTTCPDNTNFNSEFKAAIETIKADITYLEQQKIDVFEHDGYRYQKLLILLSDIYRQEIKFPMDKIKTSTQTFLQSLYSDNIIYNYRTINPAQADLGNFSRSDFSHISPINKTVTLTSKKNFRSAGVYIIPGQTVYITRNDSAAVKTTVFINTLRSGATHEFDEDDYTRPKYLSSTKIDIEPGETIYLTSPYGGPLQVGFDTNDLDVEFTIQNVGQHAYWRDSSDNNTFEIALKANDFDWAEVASPNFELHSTLTKMLTSLENDNWSTPASLVSGINRYTHNLPHALAGFKGPGIDIIEEVADFAISNNWTIETIDKVKHMNADQATCGYGCSGNPYDAYWEFNPIGHGDLHELGHGLEKSRFRFSGWEGHTITNPYSYYSKSQFQLDTGKDANCQSLPFESLFNTIQHSRNTLDPFASMQTANLTGWKDGIMIYIQMMMSAQAENILANGWHLLTRLHMLDREFNRHVNDDAKWLVARANLGFEQFTSDDANALNNNDWLAISLSYILQRDMRAYLTVLGLDIGSAASTQISSFAYPVMPLNFYASGETDYCSGLDKTAVAIDGTSPWPN